ncbi:hypothetical protein NL676_004014 [Syzygium grande]|nr:hypothetical protein NL676_004014 [Syzygium grande]
MAFGLARFPTEMALSEMRTRQSRNLEKRGLRYGGDKIVRSSDCGGKSKAKGLFGLLKALVSGHRRRRCFGEGLVGLRPACVTGLARIDFVFGTRVCVRESRFPKTMYVYESFVL